jgi:hypothetical protein
MKKLRKKTGELELFKEIAEERPEICEVCQNRINFAPHSFAHVLSKGAYPSLRLVKKNIVVMCFDCHHQYDCGSKNVPKFQWVNDLAQELKEEYYRG